MHSTYFGRVLFVGIPSVCPLIECMQTAHCRIDGVSWKSDSTQFGLCFLSMHSLCFGWPWTGIIHTEFTVDNGKRQWLFKIIDVGGQRTERRKWLHIFHGIDVVLYVMSLSAYDQVTYLMHSPTANLMILIWNFIHFGARNMMNFKIEIS